MFFRKAGRAGVVGATRSETRERPDPTARGLRRPKGRSVRRKRTRRARRIFFGSAAPETLCVRAPTEAARRARLSATADGVSSEQFATLPGGGLFPHRQSGSRGGAGGDRRRAGR